MRKSMNYQKIYDDIVKNARSQNRTKNKNSYYEKHHIYPDFMFVNRKRKGPKGHMIGDPNDINNIVLLTPREHFVCHLLLAKIYKNTRYGYSAQSALMFFFNKVIASHIRQNDFNICDSKKYEWCRKLGIEGISKARSGKMPVIDAITREMIGSISVDHPKVLSGEWVHHTKGTKITDTARKNRKSYSGSNNANYKEMTNDRKNRIMKCVSSCITENHLMISEFELAIKKEFTEFKKISRVWIVNNFGSYKNLINEYNKISNTVHIYDPYFRSTAQKMKLSQLNKRNKNA